MVRTERRLVVGLGNPGSEYSRTRHNVGFMAADRIAADFSIPLLKNKFTLVYGQGAMAGVPVVIAKPQAFMNLSGPPVRKLADYFRIQCRDMIVVHDEIDLAFNKIKIKEKGGDGGHRGVRSVMEAFGGDGGFTRIRVGIGRGIAETGAHGKVVDHVLGKFSAAECRQLDQVLETCRDAVVTVLRHGVTMGMNRFNGK